MNTAQSSILLTFIMATACGGAAGTQPHDMSAADHQAAALADQEEASQHADQHDPTARATEEECSQGKGRVCWTVETNPTEGHMKTAEEHRELAAQHRAASQALVEAETRACAGLDDSDRDVSPFAHRADVRSVSKYREEKVVGKNAESYDAGATVVFRATPGLTAEWLQRIVDCHLARNAAVGHDTPGMEYCPLVPRGVEAKVRSVGDGFAVDVRSSDAETAAEVWRRAQLISSAQ